MSRGLGRVEMAILDLLYRYRGDGIDVNTMAEMVYDAPAGILAYEWDAKAPSRREAVRRALRHLRRRGVVTVEREAGRKVDPAPHPALRALQPSDLYIRPTYTYRLADWARSSIQRGS